jgi:hypothetical protein
LQDITASNATKLTISKTKNAEIDIYLIALCYIQVSGEEKANRLFVGESTGETLKWRLHPLIHTLLESNLAPDIAACQFKEKAPTD